MLLVAVKICSKECEKKRNTEKGSHRYIHASHYTMYVMDGNNVLQFHQINEYPEKTLSKTPKANNYFL